MTLGLVKWVDRSRNSSSEDGILDHNDREHPNHETDAEQRKHREQKGLETPVVYAVNDVQDLFQSILGGLE